MTKATPLRFIITTPAIGVRLSLSGQWGNVPYPDISAAERAARVMAGASPFYVERETPRPKPRRRA